ncbi:MAG TPA: hypothetical protein VG873_14045 [Burkholderiales bacterium]|nr:hypothetical protein [Burkholderiales bacterium]
MRSLLCLLLFAGGAVEAAELTLKGTFERRTDAYSRQVLGDSVCFIPDEANEKLLPRGPGDERRAWFCFSNFPAAMRGFALPAGRKGCGMRGTAQIVVSDYVVTREGGETVDKARLERVLSKSAPRPIPCNE